MNSQITITKHSNTLYHNGAHWIKRKTERKKKQLNKAKNRSSLVRRNSKFY